MKTPSALFFLFFAMLAFTQVSAGHTTQGGNVSGINTTISMNSSWHGICGQISSAAFVPVAINATAGDITCLTINAGSVSCTNGVERLYLLFSNSSSPIVSLSRGNLSVLDTFINQPDNGIATLVFSTTFETANFGVITGVPSTYTNSPVPATFRMGYLKDQSGNLVFITPVVEDRVGFNGSLFDFQLMLPTKNRTPTMYYVTVDLLCKEVEVPPGRPPGGGGGTHTPYYNVTPAAPPGPPAPGPNITCDIVLYCEEWESCVDGYRRQPCRDLAGCSNILVYRVEKCPIPPANITKPPLPEEIYPAIIIEPESPWWLFLLLLLLLLLVSTVYYLFRRRRREKEGWMGKRGMII